MKSYRTRAIVLRRTNYGEADRILQLLTPEGKRSVMARGVRREKSKIASGIELFSVSEIVIIEGKGNLGTLRSARPVQFYSRIIEDYDRLQFGYLAIKLTSNASEMVDEPGWYDILLEIFMGLNAESIPMILVEAWFYVRYAALLGHELNLRSDIEGSKLSEDAKYRYDASEQGLRRTEKGEIGSEHIKLLRLISTKQLKVLAQIGGVEDLLDDCLHVAQEHAAVG